ncbi:putative multidrug resistance protein [Acorus gramineus]|uniref:Multidrug resistance protein n=1 Tax=Acorus gramineus TaxID=55184 RepID=A0AAV9B4X3_ACOGR|nr:putative multidrug resistance protein [Acorus gramineus]
MLTSMMMNHRALGSSLINLKYFSEATVAAASILDIIERVPSINSNDQNGKTMEDLRGELEFKNVDFAYPSRPESVVLRKFNLRVMAGETVGLIGRSGSGKSTIISLIERFYDPIEGEILLDGVCINQLQLNWLRNQISLVNQEPVLFASSIKENIEFGKSETSMEEIVAAAKAANAHDFIVKLPDGYDTHVGQLGTQMSGGQKQRIAIARALLRDPKILLLDEATSALDSHSEKAVQDTLDKASAGRTTIIIAHRLSTLRNVDSIAVLHLGRITEFGPYDQLIQDMHNQSAMAHLQHFSIQKENKENIHQMNTTNASYKSSQLQSPNHEDKKIGEKQDQFSPSLHDLIQTTAPEWKTTLLGCSAAFCYGTIQPMHSFCMGSLLTIYFIDDHSQIRTRTRIYCFIFLAYASLAFITNVIQHYNFVVMGEHISKRVHEAVLKKIFTFEVGWFDQEENNGGALCSRVATEVNILRSLVCDRSSLLAQIISAATLATILGFVLAWRLTIVILALQPLIIGSFYGRGVLMKKMSKKVLKAQNKSGELASEAVINHRVITAFSSQEKIMSLFEKTQKEPKKESRKQSWYAGLGLLISQFLTAANTGLVFWYGGHLLYQGKVTYEHLFQTFFVLVTTGRVIAETGSMTSDLSKGTDAVKSVFMILGRKSKVEPNDPDGIIAEKLIGSIEIKEVSFAYPLRPRQMVLVGLSLTVEAGKTIALVGQSGSGKSTIIGLVERFYDPLKGSIHIDGVDIRRYNLKALREGIGLVSQEPTLFAGTIYENITYGKQSIPEAEVVEAATLANAHEFISGMKDGYQTFCGERGVQLSGGQKQRIALARAILKDPAILLLDEATSALDNISESLVQEAMDKMMVRRTCIVVAHRLSTIQKSDSIAVIENGKVVEEGPHTELLKKGENGVYYSLVRLQQF